MGELFQLLDHSEFLFYPSSFLLGQVEEQALDESLFDSELQVLLRGQDMFPLQLFHQLRKDISVIRRSQNSTLYLGHYWRNSFRLIPEGGS